MGKKDHRYRALFERTNDAVFIMNLDGVYIDVNPKASEMLGYSQDELMRLSFKDLSAETHKSKNMFQRLFAGQELPIYERALRKKDGTIITVEINIQLVRDENGNPLHIQSVIRDISEKIAEQKSLRKMVEHAEEFLQLYETDLDYQKVTDDFLDLSEAKVAAFNIYDDDGVSFTTMALSGDKGLLKKGLKILGIQIEGKKWSPDLAREEAIKNNTFTRFSSLQELAGDVLPKPIVTLLSKALGFGEVFIIKILKNNIMLGDFTFIMDQDKTFTKHNIVEVYTRQLGLAIAQKKMEKALVIAKEAAVAANKAKTQFISNMSHEIRTPLNAIIGMADLLDETPLSEVQKEYIRIYKAAGETLLSLINDTLDLAKIESGKVELNYRIFNLNELIASTVELVSVRAAAKNLKLNYEIDQTIPAWISGDPNRLRQVFINLLGNAIKFSDKGEIKIRVTPIDMFMQTANSQDKVSLLFAISDTGQGIPASQLEDIFEEFSQVDPSTTHRYDSSGLGLTISRKLIKLMGGDIWAESTLGKGSTFYFNARFSAPAERPESLPQVEQTITGNAMDILLAEDGPDNRILIQHYLKSTPHSLDIAVNGKEAVDKAKAKEYDLILMDIQMPLMDGYQATTEIRMAEKHNNRKPVPIVAITAHAMEDEAKRMLRRGFDFHLSKPVKKATLLEAINKYALKEAD